MALPGLYLITDRKAADAKGLLPTLEAAFRGGVKFCQLREKDLGARELLALAKKAVVLARQYEAKILINDRTDIAALSWADGVHLTSKSYSPSEARKLLGDASLIGVSTHSIDDALKAESEGANFVTFGPVFQTKSKAGMGDPVGIARLREAAQRLSIPVYGIGGINEKNAGDIVASGANVALISAVMASNDPKDAAGRMLAAIEMRKYITRS